MKRQLTYILFSFVVLNLLVSLTLYITGYHQFAKFSFLISSGYSAVWLIVARLIQRGLNKDVDQVSIGLGAVIGLKLVMTIALFLVFYRMGLMETTQGVFLFAGYYLIYSILVNTACSKWLTKKEERLIQ